MQYCFCIIRHNMKHKDFSQILKRKLKIKSAPLQQPVSCCNEAKQKPKKQRKKHKVHILLSYVREGLHKLNPSLT